MIPADILTFIFYTIPSLLLALSLHEFGHAYAAWRLGDKAAEHDGRLSLNPLIHLDWLWGFLLLISSLWLRPLPETRLRPTRGGTVVMALSGPFANFVLAWIAHLLWVLLPRHFSDPVGVQVAGFLAETVRVNLLFAAVNLLPIPPLDAARALGAILPRPWAFRFDRFETLGIVLLVLLIASQYIMVVLQPVASLLQFALRWP
ncbi:MAG TPA: site-2 protease family protein [Limnochordia bacterium]|nr:site-2 protease family protein [Limnochordia bacterium]